MNIKETIRKIFKRQTPIAITQEDYPFYSDTWKTTVVPTASRLVDEYKNLVYVCANLNAQVCSSVPGRLYVQTRNGERAPRVATEKTNIKKRKIEIDEVMEHPFLDLIETKVNFPELIETTVLYLDVTGDAYWLLIKNGLKILSDIVCLPSQSIEIVQNATTGQIVGYKYNTNTGQKVYNVEEIVHFKWVNLQNPFTYGRSPAAATFDSINLLNSNRSYEQALLNNRARPEIILKTPNTMGDDDKRRIEQLWRKKYARGNNGGIFVADDGLEPSEFSFNPKDMQLIQVYNTFKYEVISSFNIPLPLIDSKLSPRAQLEAAQYQHAKLAIDPRLKKIASGINTKILPLYDIRLFWKFDESAPEDIEKILRIRESNLTIGLTTINEERIEAGYDEIEGGDELLVPTNKKPLNSSESEKIPVVQEILPNEEEEIIE